MVFPCPSFHGLNEEDAEDFCNNFELACLLANYSDGMMLKAFPLVIKGEAKVWYNNISKPIKEDWSLLKESFLARYAPKESVQDLLEALQWLRQEDLQSYVFYEEAFLHLLSRLELSQVEGERLPDFVVKEYFLTGLCKNLKLKVVCEMPKTFGEAIQVARLKYRRLMYKIHKIEVILPKWEPKIFEAITRDSPNIVAKKSTMQVSRAQSVPTSINELLLKPFEEDGNVKEVLLKEASKVADKGSHDQGTKEVQLESKVDFVMKLANTHQLGGNTTESTTTKKEVEQEIQGGKIPLKVPKLEEEGEGGLPISSENLTQDIVVFCKKSDGNVAYTDEEHLCEESSIEATSLKLEVTFNPSKMQTSVELFPSVSNDLEMVDASSLELRVFVGLEMGDSSRLSLVHSGFAESWDEVFMKAEGVFNGLFIMCCGIHSLCLFLFEVSMLKFQARFGFITTSFGRATTPLLQTLEDESSSVKEDSDEGEEEDDWGFDEPICVMEADIQTNVDKAMERIAASRHTKLDTHGMPNEDTYMQKRIKCIVSFDTFDTTSRLWSVLQVFEEPFQRIGACLERIFELRRAHEYLCSILMGCKVHLHDWVVLDIGIKIWDPGKCEF